MNALPTEVNDLIVRAVTSKDDLKNIRLVSKALSAPATQELFSKVYVTLPGLPGPRNNEEGDIENGGESDVDGDIISASNFKSIITSPTLFKAVRHLRYITSLEPNKTLDYYTNDEKQSNLSHEMEDVLELVNSFPNLSSLTVEFSCVCAVVARNDFLTMWPEESELFRGHVLTVLFAALNQPADPTLKSLSLKNFQNVHSWNKTRSALFLPVITKISELRLKIVTQHDEASPETAWSLPEMYSFMDDLPSLWLKPAEDNLTSLTLHMDDYWGYVPKCDFRSIHFSQLKKLELGNYTFSHDWQLDWILSHETLEDLTLDDCPIIRYMRNYGPIDQEGYLVMPTESWGEKTISRYDGRLAEYFGKMEGLQGLRRLRFGVGDWRDGRNFDENTLHVGLHQNRYMQFDRGTGPSPWMEWTGRGDEEDDDSDEELDEEDGESGEEDIAVSPNPSSAEDAAADFTAYHSLMAVLAKR